MAYLTAAIFKSDWINLSNDTSLDNAIGRLLTAAEAEIKAICNQPVEAESTVLTFFGTGKTLHPLRVTVPVTSTTLKYQGDLLDALTTVDSSDYTVVTLDGMKKLYCGDGFTSGYFWEYTASIGYAADSVPGDIIVAGYELAKEMFLETAHAMQSDRFGVSGTTEGQGGTSFSKSIMRMRPLLETKLAHHRFMAL